MRGGGGGVLPASGPIREAGGGGGGGLPFKARYEKRRREGGGGGCCPALQARYKKRGRERGCLAEEGALPYMKGGVATPKHPPPPPPPPPPPGSASDCGHFVYHPRTDFRIRYMYSLRGMHLNSHALSIWRSPISCKTC